VAQVQMALAELERKSATGTRKWDDDVEALLHAEPPPELVEQMRQVLLAEGYELEEEETE
jgi:hypothetical protein